MRLLLLAGLAMLVVPAAGFTDDDDKKPKLPDLKSKEWKKLGDAGLEVWNVKEGKGDAVKAGAKLKVHYTGWLTDGEIFDSSVVRKKPIEFELTDLIQGWKDGIPGMKVGGVRRLKIPPELGYGKKELPGIPANSTLVFEIELLEMENK
jgi:FKBP-type peptidyl-prolyl cis-trans isomerase